MKQKAEDGERDEEQIYLQHEKDKEDSGPK